LAEKARDKPRGAAELFASGAVAQWYQTNGWTYPVQDPAASGVAAIQQFFEALGVTSAPKVAISASELHLEGRGGESVRASLVVSTTEKKPVFAHAASDQPWLTVNEVAMDGRSATIHLRVPEVPDRPGAKLHAGLSVVSNGRQQFFVPVWLTVTGAAPLNGRARSNGHSSHTAVEPIEARGALPPIRRREAIVEVLPVVDPVLEVVPDPPPLPVRPPARRRSYEDDRRYDDGARPRERRRTWLALLPVVFICIGLLVTLARDIHAWLRKPGAGGGGEDFANLEQLVSIQFHDKEENVFLSANGSVKPTGGPSTEQVINGVWDPSMRFGLVVRQPGWGGEPKRLTYDSSGRTNNTVVRLDDQELIFGDRPFHTRDGRTFGNWPGRWLERNARLDRPLRDGRRSIWVYDTQRVEVTQTVGLVPGAQSGKLDTCLVQYKIENKDSQPHRVGIRFLLDTFIGGNDGVPFLIPGSTRLCNTSMVFNTPESVPDFIQARETEDLSRPGTIATIQFKIPGMEPPSRVILGAWPNTALGRPCVQEKTLWQVPVMSMKAMAERGDKADSAVVMYWDDMSLPPRRTREVAFAYGLGNVAAGEAGGALGLSVAGSFVPRGEFTLTAEVRNPLPGQTVTLTLPEGFEVVGGQSRQNVPAAAGSTISPVTWKVKAGPREGKYTLKVQSSSGVSQTQPVQIKVRGIFGN